MQNDRNFFKYLSLHFNKRRKSRNEFSSYCIFGEYVCVHDPKSSIQGAN